MTQRDPRTRKYRVAAYVLYAIVTGWIIISFFVGEMRGLYSQSGKDRLAARQAALYICSAAAGLEIDMSVCPGGTPAGGSKAMLTRARKEAALISDGAMKEKVNGAIDAFEVVSDGRLHPGNLSRLVSEPLSGYIN
jgi:hypothetical protein